MGSGRKVWLLVKIAEMGRFNPKIQYVHFTVGRLLMVKFKKFGDFKGIKSFLEKVGVSDCCFFYPQLNIVTIVTMKTNVL